MLELDLLSQLLSPQNWDLNHWCPYFSGFTLRLNYTTSFPGLQLADGKAWDFSASIIVTQFLIINPLSGK